MPLLRSFFVLLLFVVLQSYSTAQTQQNHRYLDEVYAVSVNRTSGEYRNDKALYNFGVGLYDSWITGRKHDIITGISYDATTHFRDYFFIGRSTSFKDMTYNLRTVNFYLLSRFVTGKKIKLFGQFGPFWGINIASKIVGIRGFRSGPAQTTHYYDYSADLTSYVDGGFSVGGGFFIPLKPIKESLAIKLDYQFGLRDYGEGSTTVFNRFFRLGVGLRLP